ncbi:MAG: hypothetical protein ACRYG4_22390 [Janthinobacterium lividum]
MGWWSRYLGWRQRNVVRLTSDRSGFVVHNRGERLEASWEGISGVTAYKRDLLTVDMLCLLLDTSAGVVEVNEEMDGYPGFETDLQRALGIDPMWKLGVLFPAFATNATSIFARAVPA